MNTDNHTETESRTERKWWWTYSPALAAAVILAIAGIFALATAAWSHLNPPPDCALLWEEYVAAFDERLREPGAAMEPGDATAAYDRLEDAGCTRLGDGGL